MRRKITGMVAAVLILCMLLPQTVLAATTYSLKVTLKGPDKNGVTQTVERESTKYGLPSSKLLNTVAQELFTQDVEDEIERKFQGTGLRQEFKKLCDAANAFVTSQDKSDWLKWVDQCVTDLEQNKVLKQLDATFRDVLDLDGSKIVANYSDTNDKGYTIEIEIVPHDSNAASGTTVTKPVGGNYSDCWKDHTCPIYPYLDANPKAWYHDGVHFCIEEGLMNGYHATIFAPNDTTTRAMVVTMLWRLEGKPEVASSCSFEDVAGGSYYAQAVDWAQKSGVVYGFSDTVFGPNRHITREQLIAIMWRYAKYKDVDVSMGKNTELNKFDDHSDVTAYAVDAVKWSVAANVVKGKTDTTLDPKSDATRAQIAMIFQRYCIDVIR